MALREATGVLGSFRMQISSGTAGAASGPRNWKQFMAASARTSAFPLMSQLSSEEATSARGNFLYAAAALSFHAGLSYRSHFSNCGIAFVPIARTASIASRCASNVVLLIRRIRRHSLNFFPLYSGSRSSGQIATEPITRRITAAKTIQHLRFTPAHYQKFS